MTMTVKKLITELEKIENKFLEVELSTGCYDHPFSLDRIKKEGRKVILIAEYVNE